MQKVIQFDGVSFQFASTLVLANVHFSVRGGELLSIVGASGVGKTLLLKSMIGLSKVSGGTIRILDRDPSQESDCSKIREDTGFLFQKNALFDSFTASQNLTFGMREKRIRSGGSSAHSLDDIQAGKDALASVQLSGNELLYPDQLSGGMQKRLAIARILVLKPKLCLYDDPVAGLDPITSRMIVDLIKDQHSKSGRTGVLVLNDLSRVRQVGGPILFLANQTATSFESFEAFSNSNLSEVQRFMKGTAA